MKTGIVFAGQGSQYVGIGQDFYEKEPAFREIFDLLTREEREAAFHGPEETLRETTITQPVMLAFAMGVYRVLQERSGGFSPAMAAGLSLGEYSALAAAGVFDAETALTLIRRRSQLMAGCASQEETEMSAIIGLDRETVEAACAAGREVGRVEVANYNCPGQMVVSGSAEGVTACEAYLKDLGKGRCVRLSVSGPFHTSYMEPAERGLREYFQQVPFRPMAFPVLFNYLGDVCPEGTSVKELLAMQVSHSVRFEETIRRMSEAGIERVIEIGPGKVLSGFIRKTDRSIALMQIDKAEDLDKVAAVLREEK